MSGKICGAKRRERQRTKYTDSLNNFVTRKEFPIPSISSSGELTTERIERP